MTDANLSTWDNSSLKTWDESDNCGIPSDALYCAVCACVRVRRGLIIAEGPGCARHRRTGAHGRARLGLHVCVQDRADIRGLAARQMYSEHSGPVPGCGGSSIKKKKRDFYQGTKNYAVSSVPVSRY